MPRPTPQNQPNAHQQAAKPSVNGADAARLLRQKASRLSQAGGAGQAAPAPQKQAAVSTKPKPAREADLANGLLALEREARQAQTEAELGYLIVNGSRVGVQYRQAILLMRSGPGGHRAEAVSSLSAIDRNATFIRWVERLAKDKLNKETMAKVLSFDAKAEAASSDLDASSYPFGQIALLPLQLRDGTVFAHLMLTRESQWDEKALVSAARLCETYSHAWEALTGPKRAKRKLRSKTLLWTALGVGILAAGFWPTKLSVLAPAEVSAANAYVVASPIDGTIETVEVDPNTKVTAGQVLFTYNDTELRNQVELAGQAVGVAEARYQQSLRTSFADPKAKRELAIVQSELRLKAGEYDYARELLAKTKVMAPRDGLIIFADKDTWTGRPVSTGERIMRIADPAQVELSINLPVADAIVLEEGAEVQLYLDSDPLKAIDAKLESASFHATPDGENVLSYRVKARFDGENNAPRIGLRGTAKVYGEDVTLAYFLFRKPLAVIRQWTGL
ncbi:MAG: HlyD family efflux transporter periplasmic adaptor subunit [Pseudomonadota bacterium]